MDRLTVISTSENVDRFGAEVAISPAREYSYLIYKDNLGTWRGITEGSRFRPLHLSELSRRLSSRGWNIGRHFFTQGGELWTGLKTSPEYIPSIGLLTSYPSKQISNSTDLGSTYTNIITNTEYEKILKEMNEKEINLYNTSTRGIDLVSGKQTIDVISYNSDTYTNMVSLVPLKNHIISEGISCKVDLGIVYTNSGTTLYHTTSFPAFGFQEDENWIEEVNEAVQVEYIGGIIRVMPLVSTVTECIISNCTVEYGRNN